jgi:hypothetical protein
MRLKLLLVTVFAAGIGASYALADGGHGKDGAKAPKCTEVHVNGTVAAQTLTVTLTKGSHHLNLAPGSQVVLQVGAAGQTVNVNAEACSSTTGSSTQYQVKSAELKAHTPKTTTTTATTATTATTTTGP